MCKSKLISLSLSENHLRHCKWASSVPERIIADKLLLFLLWEELVSFFNAFQWNWAKKCVFLLIRKFMQFTIMKANEHLRSRLQRKWVEQLKCYLYRKTAERFHKRLFFYIDSEWLARSNFCLPLMFFSPSKLHHRHRIVPLLISAVPRYLSRKSFMLCPTF